MAFYRKSNVATFMVVAIIMLASVSSSIAAPENCSFDDSKAVTCDRTIAPAEVLKITCSGTITWIPEDLTANTSKICTKPVASNACAVADQSPFNTSVPGVTVKKNANEVTITAPSSLTSNVKVYSECKGTNYAMAISMDFVTKSGAASNFVTSFVGIITLLVSSALIFS